MQFQIFSGARKRAFGVLAGVLALPGCATLPDSGPTAARINRAERKDNALGFKIVEIEPALIGSLLVEDRSPRPLTMLTAPGRVDTIGVGDVLDIAIYEVGVVLFGTSSAGGGGNSPGIADPTARATMLQNVLVDADGKIVLPYLGRLKAAGKTPVELAGMIDAGMRGVSQRPQAMVTIRQNLSNTVYVSGDVRQPSRLTIGLPRERLLDAIARAGGTTNQPNDMIVRLTRNGASQEVRLSEIDTAGPQNLELLPGDRIELFNRPRAFLVFGSTEKVSQVPFGASRLSLAEALARIGGPSERTADPAAIYVFRYSRKEGVDPVSAPTVYRLNMMRAQSYFLAQRFEMQDKDVIYIASAAANAPGKLAQIIGQLSSPLLSGAVLLR